MQQNIGGKENELQQKCHTYSRHYISKFAVSKECVQRCAYIMHRKTYSFWRKQLIEVQLVASKQWKAFNIFVSLSSNLYCYRRCCWKGKCSVGTTSKQIVDKNKKKTVLHSQFVVLSIFFFFVLIPIEMDDLDTF